MIANSILPNGFKIIQNLYPDFNVYTNAAAIHRNLTSPKAPCSDAHEDRLAPPDGVVRSQVETTAALDKWVAWVEEHADAENIEASMSRCLSNVASWTKEMAQYAVKHFTGEAELKVWEAIFYVGMEACLPLDSESSHLIRQ